ncbi:MAG: thioredoxin domain-containing protein [Planctomycetota bacterium]|nr:thioredoxin domain-containing protein [Planctomycetota bacterium]
MRNEKTNRLAESTSPYLLQHAHNPVDWYPWGEEAFKKARKEDKPVFLSVGYSTCHWCHVMERESFSDEEVAKALNETFVCIKVDREERPDIDSLYMTACQMMNQSAGWPLTVVLTPDRRPFYTATYLPKKDAYGLAGILTVTQQIGKLWENERDKLNEVTEEIHKALSNTLAPSEDGQAIGIEMVHKAFSDLASRYDMENGGFGAAPKFPSPHQFSFLMRYNVRTQHVTARDMAVKTLTKMSLGGIHDHLGGGFHRYSTDSNWLLPHFEKMLYDQAMLLFAYADCYALTGDRNMLETGRDIMQFVERELTSPDGAFYSALDADTEGEEGRFYVWTSEEIEKVLGDDSELFYRVYNVSEDGNFSQQEGPSNAKANVLHLRKPVEQLAKEMDEEPAQFEEKLARLREKLLEVRSNRERPHLDDKVLCDWNCMMVAALARFHSRTGNTEALETAETAFEFVKKNLFSEHGLVHSWRDGKPGTGEFLTDHASFGWACVELYEATGDASMLEHAVICADRAIETFADTDGGFALSPLHDDDLPVSAREFHDGALPSGNSIMADVLTRLSHLTGEKRFREAAMALFRAAQPWCKHSPSAHCHLLSAVDRLAGPSRQHRWSSQPSTSTATRAGSHLK